jgi:hypothetical protein
MGKVGVTMESSCPQALDKQGIRKIGNCAIMKTKLHYTILASLVALTGGFLGCSNLDDTVQDQGIEKERWNSANSPERFTDITLKYDFDSLPTSGRAERDIWPSTYWATYQDSINARWKTNELSPAEKYDMAFNGWVPPEGFMELKPYKNGSNCGEYDKEYYDQLGPLASHISNYMGNGNARDGVDNDDDGEIDECGDRDGVETWFGLCHAWVPAAMREDRPLHTIEYNGVTFHVGDIEALVIAAYNRAGAEMIGGRCNDKEVERDEQGRAIATGCRDTNPGTLHVIMSNYLGLNQRSFAEDRTYNYEVWNQPVVAYEVTKNEEITLSQANELLQITAAEQPAEGEGEMPEAPTSEEYSFNPDAAYFYSVEATVVYITESHASVDPAITANFERKSYYKYILELDENREIIGGEWVGSSRKDHPDFLWNPQRAWRSSVPNLDLEKVRELIQLSRKTPAPALDAPVPATDVAPETPVNDGDATDTETGDSIGDDTNDEPIDEPSID